MILILPSFCAQAKRATRIGAPNAPPDTCWSVNDGSLVTTTKVIKVLTGGGEGF